MIEKLHDHMVEELKANEKTDTIFVITSILLNLVILAINSTIAAGNTDDILVMLIFVVLIIVYTFITEIGLIKGKQTRFSLTEGLIKIYKDHDIDKYYDSRLLSNHQTRYNLFMLACISTALVAIIVPFLALR